MLCDTCKNLRFDCSKTGKPQKFHKDFASLRASADRDCPLCLRVFNDLRDRYHPENWDQDDYRYCLPLEMCTESPREYMGDKSLDPGIVCVRFYGIRNGGSVYCVELDVYTDFDDPAAGRGNISGRPINADPLSTATVHQMKTWLDTCSQRHHNCPTARDVCLPSRVIDVGDLSEPMNPTLRINMRQVVGQWATISHCWGPESNNFVTTSQDEQSLLAGLPFSQLPATARDAIRVVRQLGIRYLWIDSLCILQDDPSDWSREAALMGEYYRNATVTLVARDTAADTDGFLNMRDMKGEVSNRLTLPFTCHPTGLVGTMYINDCAQRIEDVPPEEQYAHSRAWTFQENVLPPRIIEFTKKQLLWSCCTCSAEESGHLDHAYATPLSEIRQALNIETFTSRSTPKLKDRLAARAARAAIAASQGTRVEGLVKIAIPDASFRSHDLAKWYQSVEIFMSREITFHSDRLPAISAIAKAVHEQNNHTYVAGLWAEDLLFGLTWSAAGIKHPGWRIKHPHYEPPSWSWASQEGPVAYIGESSTCSERQAVEHRRDMSLDVRIVSLRPKVKAQIIESGCTSVDVDAFGRQDGGYISIKAYSRSADSLLQDPSASEVTQDTDRADAEGQWKVLWDHSRQEGTEPPQSISGMLLIILYRVLKTNHRRPTNDVQVASGGANIYLNVVLVLRPTGRPDEYRREGFMELYERCLQPSDQWTKRVLTIV